jgi:hypothetical protein
VDAEYNLRSKIVAQAAWGVENTAAIFYEQRRPIDGINEPPRLPLSTDCSGFVTLCYRWAGAGDPNGRGFDGYGYTGTILDHCDEIGAEEAQRGDLVLFGSGKHQHVVVIVGYGPNADVVSHGGAKGPLRTTLQAQIDYHPDPVRYLRCPDLIGGGVRATALPPDDDDIRTKTDPPTED